jgi:hypothetical protein
VREGRGDEGWIGGAVAHAGRGREARMAGHTAFAAVGSM